jgi:DmsE family decaheme c-type cytochrome
MMAQRIRRSVPMAGVVIVAAATVLLALPREAPSTPGAFQAAQEEYVGSDLCQACHEQQADTYLASTHAGIDWSTGDWPYEVGDDVDISCEACHGPGLRHAEMAGTQEPGFREAIISFANLPPGEGDEQCLTCHTGMEAQQHFRFSEHSSVGVGCADCHSPHQPLTVEFALAESEPTLCYQCHGDKRGEFALPVRHPVDEGFMGCSDCHSPHGATNPVALSREGNFTCAKCHLEKEGPFVFPHVAAEAEGCTTCHQPHGSTTPHLLTQADISLLCYQCHQAPFGLALPSFHREDSRGVCTECHVQIHGSNLDPKFMR